MISCVRFKKSIINNFCVAESDTGSEDYAGFSSASAGINSPQVIFIMLVLKIAERFCNLSIAVFHCELHYSLFK
jgi:hypothetical protein